MSARGDQSSFTKRLCQHARTLGWRFFAVLVVLLLAGGLDAAAPALAETSLDLDIDGFGQAVAEFVDAAEFVDVGDAPEVARPAPPEFVDDALERVDALATTPLKTLTSSILNAVVPWVCERAYAIAAAAAMAASLAIVHAVTRTREPEKLVPSE